MPCHRYALVLTLFFAPLSRAAEPPAELVITGAPIYALDAARSWAEAIAIAGGRIVFVGTEAGAAERIGPATRVLRLEGGMVLPAFIDAHIHPIAGGVELGQCNLNGLETREAILEKVRACAQAVPGEGWIVGGGWDLPIFPAASPGRELLDAIAPGRPVFLAAADGHSAWVSSQALALARLTEATPDPPSGRIERDPATGIPSGTLREAAVDLVAKLLPEPTLEERRAGLRRALELVYRSGIASFQEANGDRADVELYRDAERRGELSARVVVALETDADRGPDQVAELVRVRAELASARVRPTAAKIFADGVIEARTAAMLEPYLDRPGDRGEPVMPPAELAALVAALARESFDVHVHAIGDRAVRLALDAFEAAPRGPRPLRHQIAHLEVIDPADVPRFRRLGVVANFQPLWAFADSYIRDLTWPALGPERSRSIYPMASVTRAGGVLAFGSDWSVSSLVPLEGIQVAITRQPPDETVALPMQPEEILDLPAALAAYTIGAAWALGLERETGSLEVGKAADLAILSENVFEILPRTLHRVEVLATLLEGRAIWVEPSWKKAPLLTSGP